MRWLALGVVVAACQREPAPMHGRINTVSRATVTTDLGRVAGPNVQLPARGLFWIRGGLGSQGPVVSQVAVDIGERRADVILPEAPLGSTPVVARKLDDVRARALWREAEAVWAAPKPASGDASDYVEYLVVVDGDDAWELAARGPVAESLATTLIADLEKL